MLGGADNSNGELPSYIIGANMRSNLTTQGLGKKYPVASNSTGEGRAENRRVAVVITAP